MLCPSFGGLRRLSCALIFATLPLVAQPGVDGPAAPLLEELELWLDQHSDLPRRAVRPGIALVTPSEARAIVEDQRPSARDGLRGFYDPERRQIWLVAPWSADDPQDISTLLHELVHHRQAEAGHWYCPGAQELPAYRLQEAWLAERGHALRANWVAVVLEAGCAPRDIHPD